MSGNAALAAARRRRGEDPVPRPTNQNKQPISNASMSQNIQNTEKLPTNRENNTPVHPYATILEHDKQIFILERKIELLEGIDINAMGGVSEEVSTMLSNNSSEIKLLKTTLQKQQKAIQDLNSLITNLKASMLNQATTIEELSEQINSMVVPESSDKDKKSKIKLDISDK